MRPRDQWLQWVLPVEQRDPSAHAPPAAEAPAEAPQAGEVAPQADAPVAAPKRNDGEAHEDMFQLDEVRCRHSGDVWFRGSGGRGFRWGGRWQRPLTEQSLSSRGGKQGQLCSERC
jgi:hypothetical protein